MNKGSKPYDAASHGELSSDLYLQRCSKSDFFLSRVISATKIHFAGQQQRRQRRPDLRQAEEEVALSSGRTLGKEACVDTGGEGHPRAGRPSDLFLGQKTQLLEQAQALASLPWGGGLAQGSSMTPGKSSGPQAAAWPPTLAQFRPC